MSQAPNFNYSYYNNGSAQEVQFDSTNGPMHFSPYNVQTLPSPQHYPYHNQYHYNTPVHPPTPLPWATFSPSPVQSSPQIYGNVNNSYRPTSPRTRSSLMNTSPRPQPAPLMKISPKLVPVPFETNMVPRTLPSPLVSDSSFISTETSKKDPSTPSSNVYKSPNRSQIFLERAKKLGIVCSRSKSPDHDAEKNSVDNENETEKMNKLNSLIYNDTVVMESEENIDDLFSSLARKLATDVICSAVIEINAENGISIEVDDFLKSVNNLLDDIDEKNVVLDEEVIKNLCPMISVSESNLEKLSSITSSQTSLLNPDTPEFKPLNIDPMDSMYLPFQSIPISPEYPDQNMNYNNNIHTESFMMSTRNQDFMDVKPHMEVMVEVETQTVVEMVDKGTITEFLNTLVHMHTQTVQKELHCQNTGVQTDLPLETAVAPKVKSKNKKLQTDPDMFLVKSSDPNYRYMKMLEKEVYNLRSQMCLIEIQRELHELQSTKTRWTQFFRPKRVESNGLNEMLDARMNWLQQCYINIQTQLESAITSLDSGVGLKQLPDPSIYIPTATGNQTFLPITVMCPNQWLKSQKTDGQDMFMPQNQLATSDNNIAFQFANSEMSDEKNDTVALCNITPCEIIGAKDNAVSHSTAKDTIVEEDETPETGTLTEVEVNPIINTPGTKELNSVTPIKIEMESISNNSDEPENSAKITYTETKAELSSNQLPVITSHEKNQENFITLVQSSETQNSTDCRTSFNMNKIDDLKLNNEMSQSKTLPLVSFTDDVKLTPELHDPLKATHTSYEESPLGRHKVSKLNLSPYGNLDVIKELAETIKDESSMIREFTPSDDTDDAKHKNITVEKVKNPDVADVKIGTDVLHNIKTIDKTQLPIKVEDIPLPESDADTKEIEDNEQEVDKNHLKTFPSFKMMALKDKIDSYLSATAFDCSEKDLTIPNNESPDIMKSVKDDRLEAFDLQKNPRPMNITHDKSTKQGIPSELNKDLLKAVTTQLVNDYPNLLSNPDYLKQLADHQTRLLQSYLEPNPNQQTGPRVGPDMSSQNLNSMQRMDVYASPALRLESQSNTSQKTNSDIRKVCSPGSSRSDSPVQFLQPANISQPMNSFQLRQDNHSISPNFISQHQMLPHPQQVQINTNSSYLQQIPISNSALQQQYSVNSNVFQKQYINRPAFVHNAPVNVQNVIVTQSGPLNTLPQNAPPNGVLYPVQTNCPANQIDSNSNLMNMGSVYMKTLISTARPPLKDLSPPLSIKSYLVQKDKVKSTKQRNLFSSESATRDEDSQSMDTSTETLNNTQSDISEFLNYQGSSEKDKSMVNTQNIYQGSKTMEHSGYMSDCNIDSKAKRIQSNSLIGYHRHDNSGYMSDSGFNNIPNRLVSRAFQSDNMVPTEPLKVTTAALLSGATEFPNVPVKSTAIPSLLSLSCKPDIVQRFPRSKDSKVNIDKLDPIKTIVQQPEILQTKLEKKLINLNKKDRKRNKTTSDVSRKSEIMPLPMVNSSQDDWDLEVDPYPNTFKFKTDSQKTLNFGKNVTDLCTFDQQRIQPNPSGVSKTTKNAGLKSEYKVNTQFLDRLLRSTENSNERKNSKVVPQALTASDVDGGEEEDEWKTVPKKIKKVKPDLVLPPPRPTGKKKRTVKEDAAFTKLLELMIARIPCTNRDDATYIIGEIRKKKGTLKGIPLKDIIEMGINIMSMKDKHKTTTVSKTQVETHFAKDLPPRFKRIMEHTVTELSLPKSYEEGDVCVICCDELSAEKTKALDCGHEFHIMCINEWVYKHERTCPTCRQIALFPEEFPTLGKNDNRFSLL